MVLYRHPSSLEHDTGAGHPERAARIVALDDALAARNGLGLVERESPAAERSVLEAIHPPSHVDAIAALSARGGGQIDADTVVSAGSYDAALHAAGGAVALVDELLAGTDGHRWGASLHRPPGHHCEAARPMGFCLFNTVAVAAQRALDEHGAGRVMIVDWDVHHGNGTNDIFAARDDVLFLSIHESPLYPGTGPVRDTGSGPGAGHTVNLPVPGGSGDETFVSLVEHVAAPLARAYRPGLLLVSAGYDAHVRDPLAGCTVTDAGYGAMAASLWAVARELDIPLGIVLEGGYDLEGLVGGVLATFGAILDDADAPVLDVHPLAAAARTRLADVFGALG